ncbi:nickel/cobalt transporter [Aliagarivorans marinus]|uniref:nickel/cobalt transporter n=1 Tax=Aliagarivorans marinus TaxID=561965 RepID=UPI0004179E26|nr:hypothetical protein [Aliagarivorans marinus]
MLVFAALCAALWHYFPQLLFLSKLLQMQLNREISQLFSQVHLHPWKTAYYAATASYVYGVMHAIGPGHGKVIISGYLATHPTKLATTVGLSLAASLMQAAVAITMVTVCMLVLASSTTEMTEQSQHLIRISYALMSLLAVRIAWNGLKAFKSSAPSLKVKKTSSLVVEGGQAFSLKPVAFLALFARFGGSVLRRYMGSDSAFARYLFLTLTLSFALLLGAMGLLMFSQPAVMVSPVNSPIFAR